MVKQSITWITLGVLIILGLSACEQKEPLDPQNLSWEDVVEVARGARVNFAMWGGDERINAWVDTWVAPRIKASHGITLNRIAMDASVFVGKLQNEKANNDLNGSLDLLWINGENFSKAMDDGLLFGPFVEKLPNWTLVDQDLGSVDFGRPTQGYEAPWGKSQLVLEYDQAKIPNPPQSLEELGQWIQANPGRFTYPQLPDFTGSAFIRQAFYHWAGAKQELQGPFDEARFASLAKPLWTWLREIKPYLWQAGKTYPQTKAALDVLFESGELDFNISYNASAASGLMGTGRYPSTIRTLVFRQNSLSNLHFTAIPFNSQNKAAAMVLANFLMSPEAQVSKNDPLLWGDFTILNMDALDQATRDAFASVDLGPATLSLQELGANAIPELGSAWVEAIEQAWDREVLLAP